MTENPGRDSRMSLVRVYRWCARCKRWRSRGNFHSNQLGAKRYTGRVCMRCVPRGSKGRHLTARRGIVVTEQGRAYLAAEEAPR